MYVIWPNHLKLQNYKSLIFNKALSHFVFIRTNCIVYFCICVKGMWVETTFYFLYSFLHPHIHCYQHTIIIHIYAIYIHFLYRELLTLQNPHTPPWSHDWYVSVLWLQQTYTQWYSPNARHSISNTTIVCRAETTTEFQVQITWLVKQIMYLIVSNLSKLFTKNGGFCWKYIII